MIRSYESLMCKFITPILLYSLILSNPVYAKTELPSLEKCFHAIEVEVDSEKGESLKRLTNDIYNNNWNDVKQFSREYDAGFRGGN